MLTIRNFSKCYGSHQVLAIEEVLFGQGVYWIQGENGAGKTSLFRSLAGIIPCTGDVFFEDNISLKGTPRLFRKLVNYSEAEPVYPGYLTSTDLIRFIGDAKEAPRHQQHEIAEKLGIHEFTDRACGTYSSGMLKKLSLALAFLGNPKVIILDEPFVTLDASARNDLSNLILERLASGVIFLLSSHQTFDEHPITINEKFIIRNKTLVRI